jgi:cyclase
MNRLSRLPARIASALGAGVLLLNTASLAQQNPLAHLKETGDSVRVLPVQGNVYMAVSNSANAAISFGEDGVLVVDTMTEDLADQLVAQIRKIARNKPITYIVNTHFHRAHTGGNAKVSAAGPPVSNAPGAFIFAQWNVLARMSTAQGTEPPTPAADLPHETFLTSTKELYFNGEGIQILHQPNAHTDGDSIVYFRKSDVVVSGDVYVNTTFPVICLGQGGSLNGSIAALNRILDITIPKDAQEGGTYVIPGHGRLADEADVVEYRDMTTILRDRIQDAIKRGLTLDQVKAARLTRDYDARYGRIAGPGSTDGFVQAAYRSLNQTVKPQGKER